MEGLYCEPVKKVFCHFHSNVIQYYVYSSISIFFTSQLCSDIVIIIVLFGFVPNPCTNCLPSLCVRLVFFSPTVMQECLCCYAIKKAK